MKQLFTAIAILICLTSCSKKNDAAEDYTHRSSIGKYIYLDDNYIYHVAPSCFRLTHGHDDNGHDIYAKHLIDTLDFEITRPEYFRVCSRCVSDVDYEHMLSISRRNKGGKGRGY